MRHTYYETILVTEKVEEQRTALRFTAGEAQCEWLKTDREIGIGSNNLDLYTRGAHVLDRENLRLSFRFS